MRTLEAIEADILQAESDLRTAREQEKKARNALQALREERLPHVAKYKAGDRAQYHGQLVEIVAVGVNRYGSTQYECRNVTSSGKVGKRILLASECFMGPQVTYSGPLILD